MKVKSAKGYKAKADKLTSLIVRHKGKCERCGSTSNLQCSHIMSRRYSATRCDLNNVQCLCAGCHIFYTNNPVEFARWIESSIGMVAYEKLREKAHAVTKVDWEATYIDLKRKLDEL